MTDANVQELHHSHDEDERLVREAMEHIDWDNVDGYGEPVTYLPDDASVAALARILSRYDALVAEHEWAVAMLLPNPKHARKVFERKWRAAHDNAERAMRP